MPNFQRRQHTRTRLPEFILRQGFLSPPPHPWALGPSVLLVNRIETRERMEFSPLSSGTSQLSSRGSGYPNRLRPKVTTTSKFFLRENVSLGCQPQTVEL